MEILNYMAVFEILTILAGLTSGICAALLPSPSDEKRPLAAIWCLSVCLGAFLGLLPIVADGAHFPLTLSIALVSVGIGFGATAAWLKETREETPKTSGATAAYRSANS